MVALKLLKQIIGRNLNLQDFFMSSYFKDHLAGIVKMVADRYGDKTMAVQLGWGGDKVAYTDNHKVFINLDNPIVQPIEEKETRYLTYLGFLGHELGHVLHTDFNQYRDGIEGKDVAYGVPKGYKTTISEIKKYRKGVANDYICATYADFLNIVEDGYVNARIKEEFPGTFADGIRTAHKHQFSRPVKMLDDDVANIINGTLYCFVNGNANKEYLKKYNQFNEVEQLAQNVADYHSQKERVGLTNHVFAIFWPVIKKQIDELTELAQQMNNQQGQQGQGQQGQGQQGQGQQGQGSSGSSNGGSSNGSKGKMSGNPSLGGSGTKGSQPTAEQLKEAMKNAIQNLKNGTLDSSEVGQGTGIMEEKNSSSDSGAQDQKNESNSVTDANSGSDKDSSDSSDEAGQGGSNISTNTDEEHSEKEDGESSLSNETENGDNKGDSDSTFSDNNEPADKELEDLMNELQNAVENYLTEAARDMVKNNPEKAETLLNQESARKITTDECSPHKGYPYKVNKKTAYSSDAYMYKLAFGSLSGISKRLQKRVSDIIADSVEGGTNKNLLRGNKIVPAASAKGDGKIFRRNNLPETPELAISVLLDQSGSMYGDKIQKCKEMAMLLEDFAAGLDIPIAITGHSEYDGVQLDEYITFEDYSANRRLKLVQISSNGCNRDGFALKYCMDILAQRPEEKKIMILVSDGLPNSSGYSGSAAAKDLMAIKNEYQKRGIFLIAAAIDDDKERIRDIYGNSFLDISDITNLPIKMASIISRFYTD